MKSSLQMSQIQDPDEEAQITKEFFEVFFNIMETIQLPDVQDLRKQYNEKKILKSGIED